jgi:hypothetical protein
MSITHALRFLIPAVLIFPAVISKTNAAPPASGDACPLELSSVHPSATFASDGLGMRAKNVSGKEIDGVVFDVALADAAENWKWLHWDFDDTRSLRDFGWNKPIKPNEIKKLSWNADLDFQHGSGGAIVLTSVLFADGTHWQAPPDTSACKVVWLNGNKKGFISAVNLPPR